MFTFDCIKGKYMPYKYIFFSICIIGIVFLIFSSIVSYNFNQSLLIFELDLAMADHEDIKILFECNKESGNDKYIGHNIEFGYGAKHIFQKMKIKPLYKFRFFEKREMLPLLIKGYRIKLLKSNVFNTDDITFELERTKPDIIYGYYVDERFCNFFSGF